MEVSDGSAASAADTKSPVAEAPMLVVQTAFLGDLLLTIPLLRRLKQLRPKSPVYLVAREGWGRLLKDLELVDEVFEVRKKDRSSYRAVLKQLKGIRFHWILCPHQSVTSALFCMRLRARLKVSFKRSWNFLLFDDRHLRREEWPEAIRLLALLENVDPQMRQWLEDIQGVDLKRADAYGRMPAVPEWASLNLKGLLKSRASPIPVNSKTICIFPGSVWATKQWTEEGYIELAEKLMKEGFQIYWMGSKEEIPFLKRFEIHVKGSRSMAGHLSLLQTLIVLAQSRLVISNDSGGQHLAAIAGAPTVAIFGPTVLGQGFRPWNSNAAIAELFDVKCRPCGAHGHKVCPIGTHECMRRLPAALVHQRVHQLL